MSHSCYVLDANLIAAILRQDAGAVIRVQKALRDNVQLILCPVVFYEVYRGLLHRDARKQLEFFLNLAATLTWDELTRVDWETAAHLWANLRRSGRALSDADILIGAYARRHGAVVVTRNARHFGYLGVAIENWREGE